MYQTSNRNSYKDYSHLGLNCSELEWIADWDGIALSTSQVMMDQTGNERKWAIWIKHSFEHRPRAHSNLSSEPESSSEWW